MFGSVLRDQSTQGLNSYSLLVTMMRDDIPWALVAMVRPLLHVLHPTSAAPAAMALLGTAVSLVPTAAAIGHIIVVVVAARIPEHSEHQNYTFGMGVG